jgi:hypothetical protein
VTRPAPSALESAPPLAADETLITSTRPRRQWLPAVVMALAVSTALIWSLPGGTPPEPAAGRADARVDVRSAPPGASIFVDGEPTGQRTPAVLKGLPLRPLHVRVAKAGFVPQQREVELASGAVATLLYELSASDGSAAFAGAPRDARYYVDGQEVDGKRPVLLSVGPHAVRVEAAGALIFSDRVVIVAGEQTIRVATGRAAL